MFTFRLKRANTKFFHKNCPKSLQNSNRTAVFTCKSANDEPSMLQVGYIIAHFVPKIKSCQFWLSPRNTQKNLFLGQLLQFLQTMIQTSLGNRLIKQARQLQQRKFRVFQTQRRRFLQCFAQTNQPPGRRAA